MSKKPPAVPGFVVPVTISRESVRDLLIGAFEGGSNYWYIIHEFNKPPSMPFRYADDTVFRHVDYPMNEGGSLIIRTDDDSEVNGKTEWTLDLVTIEAGLKLFAEKGKQHFADFLAENDDAFTSDVFLQFCLFGEIIFS